MADELMLEIVTPEKRVFRDVVEEVTIPGSEGEFGVLLGHEPLLSMVKVGELNFTKDNKKTYYAADAGYAEVTEDTVTVIVESALRSDIIDKNEAEREKNEAESRIAQMSKDDPEYEKMTVILARAETKLKVAEKV
ncbi:MAG: F0F1 ATP synthase subunit epsilon [Deltaproteobacteria bacterium]|nr:F0F1 ATP synthase subunit epsilon [Deltaproteobacteria bacterium]